jgi:hypothetical protein
MSLVMELVWWRCSDAGEAGDAIGGYEGCMMTEKGMMSAAGDTRGVLDSC